MIHSHKIESLEKGAKASKYELMFLEQFRKKLPRHLDDLRGQYRFHKGRKYAYDFAIPKHGVLIDIHGGTWIKGRHNRHKGMTEDFNKNNLAQDQGFLTYLFTGEMVENGVAIATIERLLFLKS